MRLGRSLTTDACLSDRHRLSSAGGRDRAALPAGIRRERRGGRSEAPPLQAGRDASLHRVSRTLNRESRSFFVLEGSALHLIILRIRSDLQCILCVFLLFSSLRTESWSLCSRTRRTLLCLFGKSGSLPPLEIRKGGRRKRINFVMCSPQFPANSECFELSSFAWHQTWPTSWSVSVSVRIHSLRDR